MSKRLFYDLSGKYILIDDKEVEKLTEKIEKLITEEGLITASSREVYLLRRIEKVKRLKEKYINAVEELRALYKEDAEIKIRWDQEGSKNRCLFELFKAIDEIDIWFKGLVPSFFFKTFIIIGGDIYETF